MLCVASSPACVSKPAEGAEEDLTRHSQVGLHLDNLRHLLQLLPDAGGGKLTFSASVDLPGRAAGRLGIG